MGAWLFAVALGLHYFIPFYASERRIRTMVFSPDTMLTSLWERYKLEYIESTSGRTLDKQRDNITTSEGESYTMLRAVWQDDRATFDRSWEFTRNNLGRKDDHLFSWKFGARADGSYGVLSTDGGMNAASDADSDIALSLLFAYGRWQHKEYLADALPIISDIWDKEVVIIGGKPYLAANDVENEIQTYPKHILSVGDGAL